MDRRIGLLLPCNVVVRAEGDARILETLDPQVMVGFTGRAKVAPVAEEAGTRLGAAPAVLGGGQSASSRRRPLARVFRLYWVPQFQMQAGHKWPMWPRSWRR